MVAQLTSDIVKFIGKLLVLLDAIQSILVADLTISMSCLKVPCLLLHFHLPAHCIKLGMMIIAAHFFHTSLHAISFKISELLPHFIVVVVRVIVEFALRLSELLENSGLILTFFG